MQNQLCKVKSFEANLLYLIFLRTFTFAGLLKNNKVFYSIGKPEIVMKSRKTKFAVC